MTAPYPPLNGDEPCTTAPDPEVFFDNDVRAAIALCQACPVRRPCLAYALTHDVAGVWGGTSDPTRREIRKAHGIRAQRIELSDTHTRMEEVRGLAAAGVSQLQIAERLDMPARSVNRILSTRKDPA